jgi:outer membrane protein
MMSLHRRTGHAARRRSVYSRTAAALCLALGLMAAPGASAAPDAGRRGEVRVVVVNVERLLVESARARAATAKIEQEFAPRRQRVQAQLRQLRDMSEKLAQDAPHLGGRELVMRQRALGELEREVRRTQAQIGDDFAERTQAERGAIAERIHAILLTLPAQLGVDLVLTRTIWHRPALDVTDQVETLLDK